MAKNLPRTSIFAPISIGNLSVGFDSLGLAVAPIDGSLLGDTVSVERSEDEHDQLTCKGSYQAILPTKKEDNIVWQCMLDFNSALNFKGFSPSKISLTLEKNIPICSGLGSSACSVVAGLHALNEFYAQPLSQNELLKLMGQFEAKISGSLHYDNVAPCYLGGLQLMLEARDNLDNRSSRPNSTDNGINICQSLPVFDDCYWVISYPGISISTKMARELLPDRYSRSDVILSAKRFASFVDASHRQDKSQAFSMLKDLIAEPYRISLLTGFKKTKQALLTNGCLAVGISGSGPTVFAVCDRLEIAQQAKQIFETLYCNDSKQCFTHICKVDRQGSRRI